MGKARLEVFENKQKAVVKNLVSVVQSLALNSRL